MTGGDPLDPPLRVDWIPDGLLDGSLPGRIGLTFLPGKHGPSVRYPGRIYRRDLDADLATLRAAGVASLLLLVEDHELDRWGNREIVEQAAALGLDVQRRPIVDGAAPDSFEDGEAMVEWLTAARRRGDVAIACMGGVGRTGTIAACALVAAGLGPDEAIATVRRARHPTAVETGAQVEYVRSFAVRRRSQMA